MKTIYPIDAAEEEKKEKKKNLRPASVNGAELGSDISPLLRSVFRYNNGGDGDDDEEEEDDGSYHDDVGQMCRTQSVDPAGAPHYRGAHVGDGHCQRACRTDRQRERERLEAVDRQNVCYCLEERRSKGQLFKGWEGGKGKFGLLISTQRHKSPSSRRFLNISEWKSACAGRTCVESDLQLPFHSTSTIYDTRTQARPFICHPPVSTSRCCWLIVLKCRRNVS